jgi:hypothetical protein
MSFLYAHNCSHFADSALDEMVSVLWSYGGYVHPDAMPLVMTLSNCLILTELSWTYI